MSFQFNSENRKPILGNLQRFSVKICTTLKMSGPKRAAFFIFVMDKDDLHTNRLVGYNILLYEILTNTLTKRNKLR